MMLKKAFIISTILVSNFVMGQSQDNRLSLHLSQNLRDYNIAILSNKYTSFDSALSQTYRAGIQYYLSRQWCLSTGLNNGFLLNQFQENKLVKKSFLTGIDIDVQFKFNNGNRIKEDAVIAPFLSFGYDISYLHQNRNFNLSPWRVSNSYGFGVNLNLSKANAVTVQTQLNQQLGGDFVTNTNYRLGYVYTFGTKKEEKLKQPIKAPDRDNDGIADVDDKCPDEMGFAKYNGCNPNAYADTNLRMAYDSLRNEVNIIKIELDSVKGALVDIKKLLAQYVDSEKGKGTIKSETIVKEKKPDEVKVIEQTTVKPKTELPKSDELPNKKVCGRHFNIAVIFSQRYGPNISARLSHCGDFAAIQWILPSWNICHPLKIRSIENIGIC